MKASVKEAELSGSAPLTQTSISGPNCTSAGDPAVGVDIGYNCTGALAATTFTHALCACGTIQDSNSLTTDGFDSSKGGPTGGLGGDVAANTGISWSTTSSIGGTLWTPGSLTSSNASTVRADLHLGGTLSGSGTFTVNGNAYVVNTLPSFAKVLGKTNKVTSVATPCNCSNQVPIASITAAHRAPNNDDATINLSPTAYVGNNPTTLDLPCGNYYLTQINAAQPLTINVHGHAALHVDGNCQASQMLAFQIDSGATLDLFVAGTFYAAQTLTLGSPARPEICRVFVAGANFVTSGNATYGCNVYAPNALITLANNAVVSGSIFAENIQVSGNAIVHYDTSILGAGSECCSATSCDDGNPCTADTCNADGTCAHNTVVNGTTCRDGNACTQTDTCQAGVCTGTNPVVCTASDQCHAAGTCDSATGVCSNPNKANGTACNDGSACTQTDTCQAGVCTGTNPVVCTASDQCHVAGTCNSATGICSNPSKANGTACNDGNVCTSNDMCTAGVCAGAAYSCDDGLGCTADSCNGDGSCNHVISAGNCLIGGVCYASGASNPTDSCQICDPAKATTWSSRADGTTCNDGNACAGIDGGSDNVDGGAGCASHTCIAGACKGVCAPGTLRCYGQTAQSCGVAGNWQDVTTCVNQACVEGACQGVCTPGNQQCSGQTPHTCDATGAWQSGATCANQACIAGTCQGVCAPGAKQCSGQTAQTCDATGTWQNLESCDDGNPCTVDACAVGVCVHTASPAGTSCSDGNACNGAEKCDEAGHCQTGTPVVCTPSDQCHSAGFCDTATGLCSNPAMVDGTQCSDGNACTKTDVCTAGVCAGTTYACDDGLECTADSCNGDGTCTFSVTTGNCLVGGVCYASAAANPGNQCEQCKPEASQTAWSPKSDGTTCDDGNACSKNDACTAGTCGGTAYTCNDGLACTSDSCNGDGTCAFAPSAESCVIAGACYGADATDPSNQCQQCTPGSNQTAWSAKANGTLCNDGNVCTKTDVCTAGSCGGTAYTCNDGLACTNDICNGDGTCTFSTNAGSCVIAGACYSEGEASPSNPCHVCDAFQPTSWSNKADGTACDDRDSQTQGDVCTVGQCQGTQPCASIEALSAGEKHTCAVRTDGSLWCWGGNDHGQLGTGTTLESSVPVRGGSSTWRWNGVSAGQRHTCGLRRDGSLWCWGDNGSGQLGNSVANQSSVPVSVGGQNWNVVAAGQTHTCGVQSNGTLWCWGENSHGTLGDGTQNNSAQPVQVSSSSWGFVTTGTHHTCGLKGDHTLWCWGQNTEGRLGDGSTQDSSIPVQVSGTNWTGVTAGGVHTCGAQLDGSMWCWGGNADGQLGIGGNGSSTTPVRVGSATWSSVSAGANYSCGIQSNGTLWCWGANDSGQIGDGTTEVRLAPTRTPGQGWAAVSSDAGHTCGTRQDGSLWCWGANESGELGDGTSLPRLLPEQIAGQLCSQTAICGNGVLETNEECDDGNNQDGDGCSADCRSEDKAPVVSVTATPDSPLAGQDVLLTAIATDDGLPTGSVLTYSWQVVSGPGPVAFSAASSDKTTATFNVAGDYEVQISVSDSKKVGTANIAVVVRLPDLAIIGTALEEGQTGTRDAFLTVSLGSPAFQPVSIEYQTQDGTATAGCDYLPRFGAIEFAPGETTKTIAVPVRGDLAVEQDESFMVVLGNASGCNVGISQATVTILNDDVANRPPSTPANRTPPAGATGVRLDPTLAWTSADPDGDPVTFDVYLGTTFGRDGQAWAQTCPGGMQAPGPIAFSASVYDDANDRMIMVGGQGIAGDLNQVWVLTNASGVGGAPEWSQLPTGDGPSARRHAAAAYDTASNHLILHGGCSGDCTTGIADTWILSNANGQGGTPVWSQLPDAPVKRREHVAVYDALHRRLIIFGGVVETAQEPTADVWILTDADGQGSPAWQPLATGSGPAGRSEAGAAYDSGTNRLVLFGGRGSGDQPLGDTWVLQNANGLGGTPAWIALSTTGSGPAPRWSHGAGYDPIAKRLVVYGGTNGSVTETTNFVFGDAWLLGDADGSSGLASWTLIAATGSAPSKRLGAAVAYSPSQNRLVVTGGMDNHAAQALLGDTATLDGAIGKLPMVAQDQAPALLASGPLTLGTPYFWRVVARDNKAAESGSQATEFVPQIPALSIGDVSLAEGNAGVKGAVFHVTLSSPADTEISVQFQTADREAIAGQDYLAASSTLVFAPGQTDATITVQVLGDTVFEANETFVVRLSQPSGASLAKAEGIGTIINDDGIPNEPPLVNAGPDQSIVTMHTSLVGLVVDDGVPTGVPLDTTWTQLGGPGTVVFADAKAPATDVTFSQPGSYVLRLTANDSLLSASDDLTIAVAVTNAPPIVNAGADMSAQTGGTVELTGLVTDDGLPANGSLTVSWSQVSGPAAAVFADASQPQSNATFPKGGTYVLRLTANDSELSASDDITVTVATVNQSPKVSAGPDQTTSLTAPPATGRIIVNGDEWVLTNDQFSKTPNSKQFALNVAAYFMQGKLGNFLAYTNNWGLAGSLLASAMRGAGHTWTVSSSLPFTFDTLKQYDAVFVSAMTSVNTTVLTAYANSGGNVYIAGGTSSSVTFDSGTFNPFLSGFGFRMEPFNNICEYLAPSITHPLFVGVSQLYFCGSNPITKLNATDPWTVIGVPARIGIFEAIANRTSALHGTVSDDGLPAGGTVTVSWSKVSGPGDVFFGQATAADTSARFSLPGTYVLRLTATDTQLVSSDDVTISVTNSNSAPVVSAGPDQQISLPMHAASLTGSVSDDGLPGPTLIASWSLVSGPGVVSFADSAAAATTATFEHAGTYVLRLTATDTAAVTSDDITVVVKPSTGGNAAPLVSAGSAQSIAFPGNLIINGGNEKDIIDGGQIEDWTQKIGSWTGANPQLASLDGVRAFQPATPGLSELDQDLDVSRFATQIDAGTQFFTLSAYYRTTLPSDVAQIRVEYSKQLEIEILEVVNSGGLSSPGDWTRFEVTRAAPAGSRYIRLKLIAQPSSGQGVGFDAVSLRPAPTAVQLQGKVLDDDLPGVGLTSSWSQVDGPSVVHFSSVAQPTAVAFLDASGTYTLRLTASDGVLTSSDQVVVTATGNQAPSVQLGPDILLRSPVMTTELTGTVSDDGVPGPLGLKWTQVGGPGEATLANPAAATTLATFPSTGVYKFRLAASDGDYVTSDSVTVRVLGANENLPPVVSAGPDLFVISPNDRVVLAGTVSDDGAPPGALVSTTWSKVSGPGVVTFSDPSLATTEAQFSAQGIYVLRLTASDTQLSATDDVVVSVQSAMVNQAPSVSAGPDQTVAVSQGVVQLSGTVADDGRPAGSSVTIGWTQVSGPSTAAIAQPTHISSAVTLPGVLGTYGFRLTASDSELSSSADVSVTVLPANQAPTVSAGPDQTTTFPVPGVITLRGQISDDGLPSGALLTMAWSQVDGPSASIASPNSLITIVSFGAVGTYRFRLTASDTSLTGSDDVTIDVKQGNRPPTVDAGPNQTIILPTRTVTLTGAVTDDGLPAGASVSTRWSTVTGPGLVQFANSSSAITSATFDAPGTYVLQLSAQDTELSASDVVTVQVQAMPPSGPAPQVALTAPDDGSRQTKLVDVSGSVSSSSLLAWRLEYNEPSLGSDWHTISTGNTPVANFVLGHFDPTLLLNGIYEIRLTATDEAGRTATDSRYVTVRGNLKIGQFTLSFKDLDLPVSGIPIQIYRNYDSRDPRLGDFGYGWTLDTAGVRVSETGKLGKGWTVVAQPGFFPVYCLQPARSKRVTVTMSDGHVYEFEPAIDDACQDFAPPDYVTIGFKAMPGTNATLTLARGGEALVQGSELYDDVDFQILDPSAYVLTLADGRQFVVGDWTDKQPGLQSIQDRNGNSLVFGRNGITHSSGKAIGIIRDDKGRILSITDAQGNAHTYTYDVDGNLASVTDAEGNATQFTYDPDVPHYVRDIIDARGVRVLRNEYDDNNRLVRTVDAAGKAVVYDHQLASNQEIVTDRTGASRTLEYDNDGNIVREEDALGGVITRTFDGNDNRTSETDALGNKTQWKYDAAFNVIETTDPLGKKTGYTYNGFSQVLTTKDALGHSTTNTYDNMGNLVTVTDALGNSTVSTYDSAGNQSTRKNRLGYTTSYGHDSFGNLTSETDSLGNTSTYTYDSSGNRLSETRQRTKADGTQETLVTSYTYDKNGRVLTTTAPDGSATATSYDAAGQRTTTTDAMGRVTGYTYDDLGRLASTSYPDGKTTSSTYDEEGRRLTSTDRAGRVTTMEYDDVGRPVKTTYIDGSFTSTAYALNGRVLSSTDAGGHDTSYEYDGAGRQSKVTDALGKATTFTYDDAGNQLAVKDARGNTMTSVYDELNRLVTTKFADNTQRSTTYDKEGQRTGETDQAGKTTTFGYDALGRLISVKDVLNQTTIYTYDEIGNRVSVKDAAGKTTTFAYDKIGRETKRTLPDGTFELKGYDDGGELVSRTDFQGRTTTYGYDLNSRLTSKTYADSSTVGFGYSATGRRTSAIDARGTTTYSYDNRDRLTAMQYPAGKWLEYGYDADGNRTTLTAKVGATTLATTFGHDVLDKISNVTDPDSRVFGMEYDDVGSLSKLVLPNGVDTAYTHDSLNRLTNIRTYRRAPDTTIASYAYTLGPTGSRTRIDEADGTSRGYQYDDLYRLTKETVTGAQAYEKSFGYDAVSNRISQTTTGDVGGGQLDAAVSSVDASAGGSSTINYTYDSRDRLQTENGTVYSWSANGNLVGKTDEATYEWDFEDRLVKVTKSDGTVVENVYDVDGVLVRTAVNGVGTEYLVDTSGGLSHVVAEVDGSGVVAVLYVRAGDMLLEEIRGGVAKMYEADGLGSVRGLLDVSGARTDTYSYEAFGTILSSTGSDANPYRFAGERLVDSVGFYQNRARWLDTRTGRFVSVDPMLGLNDGDPSALQPYLYAGARPTTNSDPTGLVSLTEGMAVHQAIGDHFVGQKFLKRTSDISISSILEQPGASRLRPDLVDSENFSIFEIKTIRGATAGAAQLAKYIAVMRVLDKQNGYNWHVGTPGEYQPPPMVPISILRTASVNPPSGGLILYDVYDNNLRRGPQDHTLPYLIMIMVLTVVLSPLGV